MEDTERDRILVETNTHVGHILGRLDEGRETFKEHRKMFEKHDKRIRDLEGNQQLLTGKMGLVVMAIGAAMLFVANFVRELISKC